MQLVCQCQRSQQVLARQISASLHGPDQPFVVCSREGRHSLSEHKRGLASGLSVAGPHHLGQLGEIYAGGFGEHLSYKTPTYAEDLLRSPISGASDAAFAMAGLGRGDVDMASIYDCYTITVVMSLEDAGFCQKGEGMQFVADHDLTYSGDFPVNTAGGQLSFGQAGTAGGMHHVCDGVRQIMGRAGQAQVRDCDTAFVSGNGGIMSEQVALLLQGD